MSIDSKTFIGAKRLVVSGSVFAVNTGLDELFAGNRIPGFL
jgi:hypothetical protein